MKKIVLFLAIMMAFSCLIVSCSDEKKDINSASSTTLIKDCWNVPYQYNFSKYVDVSEDDYIGLTYTEKDVTITDDDVQAEIQKLLDEHPIYTDITDRAAANGDFVVIDYKGFIDGKELENGAEEDAEFVLGEGSFISGFQEGIVGHEVGEKFTVDAKFPDDYGVENLNGKTAKFEMTLKKLQSISYPAIDNEFVKANTDYDTVEAYYAGINKELTESAEASNKVQYKNALFEKLIANATVLKIPQDEYEFYYNQTISQYGAYAQQYNMKFEEFIVEMTGSSVDEFFEFARENARSSVETELIYFAVADKVGITDALTKADYDKYLENIAAEYLTTPENFVAMYGSDTILRSLVWDSVMDYILVNATPVTVGEDSAE